MPSKLRHGKRRHSTLNKRKGERQRFSTTTRQPETAQVSTPTALISKVDSKISMPAPSSNPATGDYAYVIAEMKRIGMLTGIILGILIVLALVLR
jgi:hypothetical protein